MPNLCSKRNVHVARFWFEIRRCGEDLQQIHNNMILVKIQISLMVSTCLKLHVIYQLWLSSIQRLWTEILDKLV